MLNSPKSKTSKLGTAVSCGVLALILGALSLNATAGYKLRIPLPKDMAKFRSIAPGMRFTGVADSHFKFVTASGKVASFSNLSRGDLINEVHIPVGDLWLVLDLTGQNLASAPSTFNFASLLISYGYADGASMMCKKIPGMPDFADPDCAGFDNETSSLTLNMPNGTNHNWNLTRAGGTTTTTGNLTNEPNDNCPSGRMSTTVSALGTYTGFRASVSTRCTDGSNPEGFSMNFGVDAFGRLYASSAIGGKVTRFTHPEIMCEIKSANPELYNLKGAPPECGAAPPPDECP